MDDALLSPEALRRAVLAELARQPPAASAPAATPHRDPARVPRWLGLVGSNLFDAGTTLASLKRGSTEVNPLMRGLVKHPAASLAVKGAVGALQALVLDKLHKPKPKLANAIGFGLTGANTALGIHNMRQARDDDD